MNTTHKNRHLMVGILLILVMLFGLVGTGFGQGFQPGGVVCGDLPEEDCAILEQSATTMQELDSIAFDMQASVGLGGFEVAPGFDQITLDVEMQGAIAADISTMNDLANLGTVDIVDIYNPETLSAIFEAYSDVLNSTQMSMEMAMILPPLLTAMDPEAPGRFDMQVLVDEGVIYLYVADPTLPDGGEWIGMDMSNVGIVYQDLIDEMFAAGEMPDSDALGELGDFSDLMDNAFFGLLNDPEFISQYVAVTRLDDEEMNGETMAVFETSFDYGAIFANEALQTGFADYMELVFGLMEDPTLAEPGTMEHIQAVYGTLFTEMFNNMEMTQTQWIGLDTLYSYRTESSMTMSLDLMTLIEQIATLSGEPVTPDDMAGIPTDPLTINFSMVIEMHNFNEPVEINAPDGIQVIDPFAEMGPMS